MPRTTKTITFSLPPEMAIRVDEVMKQEGKSRSGFIEGERMLSSSLPTLHRRSIMIINWLGGQLRP